MLFIIRRATKNSIFYFGAAAAVSKFSAAPPSSSIYCGRRSYSYNSSVGGGGNAAIATDEIKGASKEALMQLRRRTGYSISKCKQALVKFGNDLDQAENWLQESARKEGWEKINKRANVTTTQGLLGMIISKQNGLAAVVQVNCQTDFVARNQEFRSLVAQISRGVFTDAARNYRLSDDHQRKEITSKWNLSFERVSEKGLAFGETLPDLLAAGVGRLGEKIEVAGAYVMRVADGVHLAGYVHPRAAENIVDGVPTGHFATLVAYRCADDEAKDQLGLQLCQHIIGMNPIGIGEPPKPYNDEESTTLKSQDQSSGSTNKSEEETNNKDYNNKDENERADEEEDRESAQYAQQVTRLSNETTLLRQDFLLEPDLTVHEFLEQNDAAVLDFLRLERGSISAVHHSNSNSNNKDA